MDKYFIGIDIGGTTVKFGLFNTENFPETEAQFAIPTRTENEGADILPDTADAIEQLLKDHNLKEEDIAAARVVMRGTDFVQLPCSGVVSEFRISRPELEYWLAGKNALAERAARRVQQRRGCFYPVMSRCPVFQFPSAGQQALYTASAPLYCQSSGKIHPDPPPERRTFSPWSRPCRPGSA